MSPQDFYKYFSYAESVGVRIYPIPIVSDGSILKIAINNRGNEKIGTEKYKNKDVYDKIKQLYKTVYEKNNKSKT